MFKTIGAVILIIIMVLASVWLIQGIAYSYKVQRDVQGEDGYCYFDRGFIRTPFVKICRTNESLTFTKKGFEEYGD